jgi:hypothetical protein
MYKDGINTLPNNQAVIKYGGVYVKFLAFWTSAFDEDGLLHSWMSRFA